MIKKKQISANYRKIKVAPAIPYTSGLTMGIIISGGIGDHIQATQTIQGLIRKFQPQYTELYTQIDMGIFDDIKRVSQVTKSPRKESLHETSMKLAPYYDIWVDLRYISKIYLSERAKKLRPPITILQEKSGRRGAAPSHRECDTLTLGNHPARWWHTNFLTNNNELGKMGKNLMNLRDLSLDIKTTPNDMSLGIKPVHIQEARELTKEYENFICIHHGAYHNCTTKLWQKSNWEKLVETIKQEIKIPVVQIGILQEDTIDGTINLLGQTTIQSAAIIAASASAYIDIEGGIIHARRAITTDPAIVLFGATPIKAFGYDENINISANVCEPCWWITPQWATTCPRNADYKCMKAITPKRVFDAVFTCVM